MATKIFGYSDDNVCAESTIKGEIRDEWGCYHTDLILTCSDGTKLRSHYGKTINGSKDGVWSITVIEQGSLFDRLEECFDSDADIYSDIVYFHDGLKSIEVEGVDE